MNAELRIEDEGDEDARLWVVQDDQNNWLFASNDKSKCGEFVKNYRRK